MAAKKITKEQKKREQEPRKQVATQEELLKRAGRIMGYAGRLQALAADWPEGLKPFEVDGWQKFKRGMDELKGFIDAVEYFKARATPDDE